MLPRLPWLVLILIAAALLAVGADAISNDTWLGIAGGREVIEHGFGTAEHVDPLGTHDWADQQWGAHLVFYGVWRLARRRRSRDAERRAARSRARALPARGRASRQRADLGGACSCCSLR